MNPDPDDHQVSDPDLSAPGGNLNQCIALFIKIIIINNIFFVLSSIRTHGLKLLVPAL